MDAKSSSVISALAAAGITALYFTVTTPTETISKQPPVYSDLLAKATPECRALVSEGCVPQRVTVNDGSKCVQPLWHLDTEGKRVEDQPGMCEKMTGWSCNGAYQPKAAQDCLDEAAAKLESAQVEGKS